MFNIKGNDYRLVVAVAYRLGAFYIKFVGTTMNTTRSKQKPWNWSNKWTENRYALRLITTPPSKK